MINKGPRCETAISEMRMTKTFISHAEKDGYFADLIKMKLKEAGIQVWLDNGALHAGQEWRKAIDDGIASSDVCLVIVTPKSCKSSYVTYEWAYALGKGIKVIPLLFEDADIHPRLAVLQNLDFRDTKMSPWAALINEIGESGRDSEAKDNSAYVRDMTVEQLQGLISGAVALAAASAKTGEESSPKEDISRAAKSVVAAMRNTLPASAIPTEDQPWRKQILWVDDRPNNNIYERNAFEAMGYQFTLALSTNEALDILSKQRFAAIISDMGRKEGPTEGYVLLDALRNKGDKIPFFIYAGSNSPQHKREAAAHGAQGSTNHAQELFDMVTRLLQ
jgi:CheY-like chemotaxis protein